MATTELQLAAQELHGWFADVLDLADKGLFAIAPEGPHRGAVILDVMTRNARLLVASEIDQEGRLYKPLSLFLAAACRKLKVSLGPGHWRAAVQNVLRLQHQTAVLAMAAVVDLDLGGPVHLFDQELKQAISQAGLSGAPTMLDPENREIALGLAINWGMRFLLAYARECNPNGQGRSDRKDLAWIAGAVAAVEATLHPPVPDR